MPEIDTEARRKEREQNQIPQGPRWLWDWRWWVSIAVFAVVLYMVRVWRGMV